MSLVNNNPITSASEARIKSDVSNMQGGFTNAVSKVMAESQDVIEITSGPLNTVTSGEKSAVGNAVYKLSDGTNGEVIFDTLPNEGLKYYTGKRLPIYNKKTTWYVDEDGIISLEVGDKKYGEGQIVKSIKIVASVIPSEEYIKTKATVKVEISSEEDIASIKFGGKDIEVPERKEGKYEVEIEVTENGTYEIEVSGVNGATNKAVVEVNEIDNLNEQIGIKETVTITEDYVKGNIGLEITYSKEIESIKINGESITVPNKVNGKYTVSKEVLENGEYEVEVKAKDGTTNKVVVKVEEITEDMDIWNRADMESFRNKVNSGRTFETKKATVRANINLGGSASNKWIPIANYSANDKLVFKGTFDGNNKMISGLYIDTTNNLQGLFSYSVGEIRNVKVSGTIKNSGKFIGGVVASNGGKIINCHSSVNIAAVSSDIVGGVVGYNVSNSQLSVKESFNQANVNAVGFTAGGIVGYNVKGSVVNCYNTGRISSTKIIGGICGAGGTSGYPTVYTYNCYNLGSFSGSYDIGNITGWVNANGGTFLDINSYTTNATVAGLNSGIYSQNSWKEDKSVNINNGYPILSWQ